MARDAHDGAASGVGSRPRRRWALVAVGLLAGSVVLTGCTATQGAEQGPTVGAATSTPQPTPTPTIAPAVAEPGKPERWADTGPDGAAAAAVWFLADEYRYVIETNDTTEWERLSHPECEFCARVTSSAASMLDAGWTSRQDQASRVHVIRIEELNPLAYSVLLEMDQEVIRDFDPEGNIVRESAGGSGQALVTLLRAGHDWQLRAGEWFDADADVPRALEGQ